MAQITDYASLVTAVTTLGVRSDFATNIDYFIQLSENKIYRDILAQNEGRGVKPMEKTLALTIASGVAAVPTDYLALKTAQVNIGGDLYALQRKNEEFIYTNYPTQSAASAPQFICHSGSNFIFAPYPD